MNIFKSIKNCFGSAAKPTEQSGSKLDIGKVQVEAAKPPPPVLGKDTADAMKKPSETKMLDKAEPQPSNDVRERQELQKLINLVLNVETSEKRDFERNHFKSHIYFKYTSAQLERLDSVAQNKDTPLDVLKTLSYTVDIKALYIIRKNFQTRDVDLDDVQFINQRISARESFVSKRTTSDELFDRPMTITPQNDTSKRSILKSRFGLSNKQERKFYR